MESSSSYLTFNEEYFKETLTELLSIDSPTGYTKNVVTKLEEYIQKIGFNYYKTNKDNIVVDIPGKNKKTVALSAHIDTLGLIVRGVNKNGTLTFSQIGGAILPTLDGEYCNIYSRDGNTNTGTILSNSPSSHVYEDASELKRDTKNMHIRIDAFVKSKECVKKLGIRAGDFICYEPKAQFTKNGFIKSRFLDDKMSVAIILTLMKHIKKLNLTPAKNIKVIFSTYEEVGHGLAHLPEGITEVVAVDMGCIGDDLFCTERDVSICAKDSSGPYDYELTTKLIHLAQRFALNFAVDIYPRYRSDVSAARCAGHDIIGALIGPGVAASHGMERSHILAAKNTFKLLYLYLAAL